MEMFMTVYPYLIITLICVGSSCASIGSIVIAISIAASTPTGNDTRISNLWAAFWTLILGCVIAALLIRSGAWLLGG